MPALVRVRVLNFWQSSWCLKCYLVVLLVFISLDQWWDWVSFCIFFELFTFFFFFSFGECLFKSFVYSPTPSPMALFVFFWIVVLDIFWMLILVSSRVTNNFSQFGYLFHSLDGCIGWTDVLNFSFHVVCISKRWVHEKIHNTIIYLKNNNSLIS